MREKRFDSGLRRKPFLPCLTRTTVVPRLRVLRQAPIVTFFGVGSIDEELSSQSKKTSVWIVRVDVFMKKHCDVPVAPKDLFGTSIGKCGFHGKRLKCDSRPTY